MSKSGQAAFRAQFESMNLTPAERAFVNQPRPSENRDDLLDAALAELRAIIWANGDRCPRCLEYEADGHAPNCTLAAVLARADTP